VSYQTGLPGLRESINDTLKALMVAKIADLNTQLHRRAAPLSAITAVAGQFYIGDFDTLPDPATNPFWITIIGGGRQDGRDMTAKIAQSGPGYRNDFYTNIFAYTHPQTFPGSSVAVQAEARERMRAILEDWLMGDVFNNGTNFDITLGSRQFAVAPDYDHLTYALATDVTAGISGKSFGQAQLIPMLHIVHAGWLQGGS